VELGFGEDLPSAIEWIMGELTLLLRVLKFASKLPGTPTPLIPYPCVTIGAFVKPFHWEISRTMRTRFGILFVVAFVPMLGAAACGECKSRWTRRFRGYKTKQRRRYREGARR
jgi:hypothetical protein